MLILLLPRPPADIDLHTLRAAYEPALSEVLRNASLLSARRIDAVLDVALDYPEPELLLAPRTRLYARLQRLFGLLYSLIVQICTKEAIDIQLGNDVNSRVFLLDSDYADIVESAPKESGNPQAEGPFVDIYSLAQCSNRWKILYSVDSVDGKALLARFMHAQDSLKEGNSELVFEKVKDGFGFREAIPKQPSNNRAISEFKKCHHAVAVGGSFDHLHAGHKLLLTMTTAVLEPKVDKEDTRQRKLIIGISGDELLRNKKFASELQSWNERQAGVRKFLMGILVFQSPSLEYEKHEECQDLQQQGRTVYDSLKSGLLIEYVEISDPYGPTITDETISALVLSGETRAGGKAVNDKRLAKGWSALEVFEVDVLDGAADGDNMSSAVDQSFDGKISSTEIRRKLHEGRRSSVEVSKRVLENDDSPLRDIKGVELRRMLHDIHNSRGSRLRG